MTFAFKTRDGLIALAYCPEIDGEPDLIMRPCFPWPPAMSAERLFETEYRQYRKAYETCIGHPLYVEVEPETKPEPNKAN